MIRQLKASSRRIKGSGRSVVFQERVPGAEDQAHTIITGAGHFVQEDKGAELAEIIAGFIAATPVPS